MEREMELRQTLARIDTLLGRGQVDDARRELAAVRRFLGTDTWIDAPSQQRIVETAGLLRFVARGRAHIRDSLADQIVDAVDRADVIHAPFRTLTFDKFLDVEHYDYLTENFPARRFLAPRKDKDFHHDGTFQRYEVTLKDRPLAGAGNTVRTLWLGLADAFELPAVQRAICRRTGSDASYDMRTESRLMVDRAGFAIAPHTDGGNGAIVTLQVYLPSDGRAIEYGTEFFRKTGDEFSLVHKRDYCANQGHLFRPTADSWHGMRTPLPRFAEGRRMLVVRYLVP